MILTDNLRGILAILASATGFVINDAFVKLLTTELSNSQIIVLRGLLATLVLAGATSIAGSWRHPRVLLQKPMLIRLVGSAFATMFIVASLRHLPLATASAIFQLGPLAVTAGAALLLGAPVGWRRWLASIAGFVGVMFIIKPGTASFVAEAWIAMVALLFVAVRDLTTRFIDPAVPSLFVAMASAAVIAFGGLFLIPFDAAWVAPSVTAWALLAGCGVSLYFAYYFGVVAMRIGDLAVVAPFRYALVLESLLLGYMFWGHVPDTWSFVGIAIVVLAGLYLLHRERIAAKAASVAHATATTPAAAKG